MNDDIIKMAEACGIPEFVNNESQADNIMRFAELVRADEPAKWHHPECEGECIACLIERVVQEAYGIQGLSYLQRHLTSSPAQREPLTDDEIDAVERALEPLFLDVPMDFMRDFARAIEAAHGIKENT